MCVCGGGGGGLVVVKIHSNSPTLSLTGFLAS